MAEERIALTSWLANNKTKQEMSGLSGEKLIEYVFNSAFTAGRKAGYSKGYDEAMANIGDFGETDVIDDSDVLVDIMDDDTVKVNDDVTSFDATTEIFC